MDGMGSRATCCEKLEPSQAHKVHTKQLPSYGLLNTGRVLPHGTSQACNVPVHRKVVQPTQGHTEVRTELGPGYKQTW